MRWLLVALCPALLAVGSLDTPTSAVPSAVTRPAPARAADYGQVLNILPPGSAGNVDGAALAEVGPGPATATSPVNFADQLEKYDALNTVDPDSLTDAQLPRYFKDASLGVDPQDVVRTQRPRPGVTIRWDTDGVPHITGRTNADLAYGAGVANIETRMFLTDVLRHTGSATMAQFVGPTEANIAQDAAQLAVAPYTPAQLARQIDNLAKRSPEAARLVRAFDAYIEGMNDTQERLCPASTPSVPVPGGTGLGFGEHCPAEYAALQRPPEPYTRTDIVSIASLVGGIFGTGGGGQYTNAIWLQQLQEEFGARAGRRIYDDLRGKNDPESPVTSPVRAPYGGRGGVRPHLPGVALPDLHPSATQLGTGAIVNPDGSLSAPPKGAAGDHGNASTTDPRPTPSSPRYGVDPVLEAERIRGTLERALAGEMVGMSNALLVDAEHSASGHPTAVFGPQTGYYAPQLFMEEELHGPHTRARGVAFAGTNFVVQIGRGVDYAWSATSPYTDITDTVVQRLCNTDGSPATVDSTAYVASGDRCRPMVSYVHTETGLPNLASPDSPKRISFLVLRTDHGVVRLRTTVDGEPVAVVRQRSTYMHETDSVLGFVHLNDPARVRNAQDFMRAASKIQYTFNWYYLDDRDIAYYSSARLPRRAPGTDLDLPRWGDDAYDWRGFEPFRRHPHVVNPASGYLVNWNNKLAPGFASASQKWGDGPVYRSLTLVDRVEALFDAGRPVHRSDLVGAMIDAATVDLRAAYVLPWVLDVVGTPTGARDRAAVRLLRRWVADDAHRVDRERTGAYGHQAAIALLDHWWDPDEAGASCSPDCGFALPRDAMSHGLGAYVNTLPVPLDDHPRGHVGSAFNGIAWYGYLNKDLRATLGRPVRGDYSRSYCGPRPTCRGLLRASLHRAVQAALATQGVDRVEELTYDKSADDIVSVPAGVLGVRRIDWQNRPTFQQVVQFTGHR